jgi:hypothetical protein
MELFILRRVFFHLLQQSSDFTDLSLCFCENKTTDSLRLTEAQKVSYKTSQISHAACEFHARKVTVNFGCLIGPFMTL